MLLETSVLQPSKFKHVNTSFICTRFVIITTLFQACGLSSEIFKNGTSTILEMHLDDVYAIASCISHIHIHHKVAYILCVYYAKRVHRILVQTVWCLISAPNVLRPNVHYPWTIYFSRPVDSVVYDVFHLRRTSKSLYITRTCYDIACMLSEWDFTMPVRVVWVHGNKHHTFFFLFFNTTP